MFTEIKSKSIEGAIAEIIDQYAFADNTERPWIEFDGMEQLIFLENDAS